MVLISIHAPLTGSDRHVYMPLSGWINFNPRSPYGERLPATVDNISCWKFQSTLPLRGATKNGLSCAWIMRYFNPRSPYGERR